MRGQRKAASILAHPRKAEGKKRQEVRCLTAQIEIDRHAAIKGLTDLRENLSRLPSSAIDPAVSAKLAEALQRLQHLSEAGDADDLNRRLRDIHHDLAKLRRDL